MVMMLGLPSKVDPIRADPDESPDMRMEDFPSENHAAHAALDLTPYAELTIIECVLHALLLIDFATKSLV